MEVDAIVAGLGIEPDIKLAEAAGLEVLQASIPRPASSAFVI